MTTGQTITDLSPPAQTTTARPVKLLIARIEPTITASVADDIVYFGTTVVTRDAEAANAVPDPDGDPAHGWHWWDAFPVASITIPIVKEILLKTQRIIKPDFRYVMVIHGDGGNGGTISFDVKLRLLWQL